MSLTLVEDPSPVFNYAGGQPLDDLATVHEVDEGGCTHQPIKEWEELDDVIAMPDKTRPQRANSSASVGSSEKLPGVRVPEDI
jgi:hypothetical protein